MNGSFPDEPPSFSYPTIKPTKREADSPPMTPVNVEVQALEHSKEEARQKEEFSDKRQKIMKHLESVKQIVSDFLNDKKNQHLIMRYPENTEDLTMMKIDVRSRGKQYGPNILPTLEDSSIDKMLCEKLFSSLDHLQRIYARVNDTSSKVLITGDLNSGKSTLINALLRRDLLPSDQQPCTTQFCEVLDAGINRGKEEVHAIKSLRRYNLNDPSTYTAYGVDFVKTGVRDEDADFEVWKVYCKELEGENLLRNGLVDVALIDSPGLNRDMTHTMAVVAQEKDIDAVIFVVNAENHFTLSGVEFLNEARHEKPYMFVVVNRFDSIVDKNRCRKDIMKQVQQLLPQTYEESDELVHFVSAREYMRQEDASAQFAFQNLEACLKSFLLGKRMKSKLAPAVSYLSNLLSDLQIIAKFNEDWAARDLAQVNQVYARDTKNLDEAKQFKEQFDQNVERDMTKTLTDVHSYGKMMLDELVASCGAESKEIHYPGILRLWSYADAIVRNCNETLKDKLLKHEQLTRDWTSTTAKKWLDMCQASIAEWDALAATTPEHVYTFHLPASENVSNELVRVNVELADFMEIPSNIGMICASVGASTVVAAGFIGYRRVANGLMQIGSLFGVQNVSTMIWSTVAVIGIGSTVVVLMDAQNTVQRRMSRNIRRHLKKSERIQRRLQSIGYASRKSLENASFYLKRDVCKAVETFDKRCVEHNFRTLHATSVKRNFESLRRRSEGILSILDDVDSRVLHSSGNDRIN